MRTVYETSIRLVFWGDNLVPEELVNDLGLNIANCTLVKKGDALKGQNRDGTQSYSKTGRLIYLAEKELPHCEHDPAVLLGHLRQTLFKIPTNLTEIHDIEKAELQISIFYEKKSNGSEDFCVSDELMFELGRHQISLRISALP